MTRRAAWILAAIGIIAIQALPAVGRTVDSLPGGTAIEVDNTNPTDGDVLLIPLGSTTRNVLDEGVARVGSGAPNKDTTVVYIMDVSASMDTSAGVDCDGIDGDDTRLVCEQVGIESANEAARHPNSPVGATGIGSFHGGSTADVCISTAHDVDLGNAGDQLLVAPDYDSNGDGVADVVEVASGLSPGAATCYFGGLQRADEILGASDSAVNIVVFLSDGINNTGSPVSSFLPTNFNSNTTVLAFALGTGVSCESDQLALGSLDDIAATSTSGNGSCQQVTDLSELALEVTNTIGATLDSLHISVDGGPDEPIPASDIDTVLPGSSGLTGLAAGYATSAGDLGPGEHTICVRATGSDSGGSGSVEDCKTIRLLQLTAGPAEAINDLAFEDSHTVTATVLGDAGGTPIEFVVSGQNAGATGTCAPNPDCTTDAAGQVEFTYTVPVAATSLGFDTITVTLTSGGERQSIELSKEWVDTTPPAARCVETVNPAGKNIPRAPGKGGQGQNQDGFYEIGLADDLTPSGSLSLWVIDSESGARFGPFADGTRIKYTEANGATPRYKAMAGNNGRGGKATAVDYHIWGQGDATVVAISATGKRGPAASCLVPPAPK